jgi:hypothetical protein
VAETIQVGVLRAVLTADTAKYTMGLREASSALSQFEGQTKRYSDGIIKGMSAAGKAATDSAKMIAGMSASGQEALAQSQKSLDMTAQAGSRAGQALAVVAGVLASINIGAKAISGSGGHCDRADGRNAGV